MIPPRSQRNPGKGLGAKSVKEKTMTDRYKVGYYDESGKRHYDIVATQEEAIALASSTLPSSDHITIKKIKVFSLIKEGEAKP